jgi:hypothetical protein
VVAIYADGELEPAAVLRVSKTRQGFQRKGFFRIGVLPAAVLEGVMLEIRRPDALTNALAECHPWFTPQSANRLELREVQLVTSGTSSNRLTCGRALPTASGTWELRERVRFESGTNSVEAPTGWLQVSGPDAGRLILSTTPPLTVQLSHYP